ncbi:MAG: parallel beta-helix domain-containing protein [Anaerolineae bacterium]
MLRNIGKWVLRVVGLLLVLFAGWATTAGIRPIAQEPVIPAAEAGAGSSSVLPSYTGLQREFPELEAPDPAAVELGRNLFFDAILSADNDMSCASCHQPEKGFADGRTVAETADGTKLARNAPTLWNVGYLGEIFHDGRASSLEEQAETALLESTEMNADPDQTVAELEAIPEYVELFEEAFGADSVNFENVALALAAFERTLITKDAPFDRYAAGDFAALTPAQRRGLTLFRSGATRCFECHANPTFHTDTFRVIGVQSGDPGRAGVADNGIEGSFRVPSLRNIALTAPYMHNGEFETLEEVIQFYADGGGRQFGDTNDNIDAFIQGFELNTQEKSDLVAYLHALTDESQLPEVPEVALSGLPIEFRGVTAGRAKSARLNRGTTLVAAAASRGPLVITADPNRPLQEAIDRALPGDTVLIPYGTYNQRLVVDVSGLTIRGIPNEAGEYPIFDGQNVLPEAVIASGNDFELAYLTAINYTDNGFLVEGVTNLHMHHLETHDTGTYGIYPVKSTNVLVEHVIASGVNDAAIYAGQTENVVVRNCETYDSVIGVEIENSINGDVYDCHIHGNSLGILYVVLPNLTSKVSRIGKVYNNVVEDNNRINDGPAGAVVADVPPGTGLLIFGSDNIEVFDNTFRGNKTTGTAIFSLTTLYSIDELDVAPDPENNWLHNNSYENNGYDPVPFVKALGIPTGDILWDGNGWDNRFDEPEATGGFPPYLPSKATPTFFAKIYYRLLKGVLWIAG